MVDPARGVTVVVTQDRTGHGGPRWSPDGSRIAFATVTPDGTSIETVAPDGKGRRTVLRSAFPGPAAIAWSPDGDRLALITRSETEAGVEAALEVMRASDGADRRELDRWDGARADAGGLSWSPDGRLIAYVRADAPPRVEAGAGKTPPGPPLDVAVADAAGAGAPRRLDATAADDLAPAFTPDGRWVLALRRSRGGFSAIVRIPVDGGAAKRVVDGLHDGFAAPSPDGRTLAVVRLRPSDTAYRFMLVDAADGAVRGVLPHAAAATRPAWSPDGTRVAFVANGVVQAATPDGASVRILADPPGSRIEELSWSPDGRRLAMLVTRG